MRMVKEEASPGTYVHHPAQQTLDLDSYEWVKLFVRDQELRRELQGLEEQIIKTQNSLIDREELRQRFEGQRAAIKTEFLELTAASFGQVQARNGNLFDNVIPQQLRLTPLIFLSDEDIDKIFSSLPQGIKEADISKKVLKLEKRIEEINGEIEKSLSPKSRWYHTPSGDPEPYPKGDRWLEFVSSWRETASRYTSPVNYRGEKLLTLGELEAWKMLEFDKLSKPFILREPRE